MKKSLESLDNSLFKSLNSQDMATFKGGAEEKNTETEENTHDGFCPDWIWIVDEPGRPDCPIYGDHRYLPPCEDMNWKPIRD